MFEGAVDMIWEINMRRTILTTAAVILLGSTSAFAGGLNIALIGQAGFANTAGVDQQTTAYSVADVGQVGYQNNAAVEQTNKSIYNTAVVRQYGARNNSVILQYGLGGNSAETVQYGAYNQAAVVQGGVNSIGIISQVGVGNQAWIKQ